MLSKSRPERDRNGKFGPGNRGRPKGTKNKSLVEVLPIKQMAAQLLLDPAHLASLALRLRAGDAPHMEKFFAEHLWGKPKEHVEVNITYQYLLALLTLSDLEMSAFLQALEAKNTEAALKLLRGGRDG